MVATTISQNTALQLDPENALGLDLGIEELDEMVAPGFWEWAGGVAAGAAVGGAVVFFAT